MDIVIHPVDRTKLLTKNEEQLVRSLLVQFHLVPDFSDLDRAQLLSQPQSLALGPGFVLAGGSFAVIHRGCYAYYENDIAVHCPACGNDCTEAWSQVYDDPKATLVCSQGHSFPSLKADFRCGGAAVWALVFEGAESFGLPTGGLITALNRAIGPVEVHAHDM